MRDFQWYSGACKLAPRVTSAGPVDTQGAPRDTSDPVDAGVEREVAEASRERRQKIDIPTLSDEKDAFRKRIVGQEEAVDAFAGLIAKARSSIRPTEPGPFDARFLAGPSGVGKTEIVETFAEVLAEDPEARKNIIKINGGEYQEEHTISRLIGAPPGYRGSDDPVTGKAGVPRVFSQENLDAHRIHFRDNSGQQRSLIVVLVDEAEKAHDAVHRLFLTALDKGTMDMANNKTTDFRDVVVLYTSNVGNDRADATRRDLTSQGGMSEAEIQTVTRSIINQEFRRAFPPEFQGRITDLVQFENLNREALEKIVAMRLQAVRDAFTNHGINVDLGLSPVALEWLIEQGYNPTEGARAMKKLVASNIQGPLMLVHDSMEGGVKYPV